MRHEHELEMAGLQTLHIEQVADQLQQMAGVAIRGGDERAAGLRKAATGFRLPAGPSAPTIEVSGVRNSWLTVATNSSFMRSTRSRTP
ncbi:MAG: hypothetical protein WDO56_06710 [Gammaproteobacteria bacterium]